MLAVDDPASRMLYHALRGHADIVRVVIEDRVSRLRLVRHRVRRLGVVATVGQMLFILVNALVAKGARRRVATLAARYGLDDGAVPSDVVERVESVNSPSVAALLTAVKPDAVVVSGTRIIAPAILGSVRVPFLNGHMGMTPKYRGVHGAYWALANRDEAHCGVTVHLVDEGVDTGGVLYQERITVETEDNFNTYPIHQLARIIPLMRAALADVVDGTVRVRPGVEPSRLWYHPTLLGYLKRRVQEGIR